MMTLMDRFKEAADDLKHMGREEIEKAHCAGVPAYHSDGVGIIREMPDGSRERVRLGEDGEVIVDRRDTLSDVLAILRSRKDELVGRGVVHLWVFGSVARGEEREDSDVDLAVEISPEANMSLTGFARLRLDLTDILGRTADLVEWRLLADKALPSARRDAVHVF
jgi:predicted nucleotidyltransferase